MERDLQMRFRVRRRRLFTFLIALFDAGKPRRGCAAVKKNSSFADLLLRNLESLGGKTESSSGVVAFVDAGGLPGAGSAAVLARLLHAAGAGVGETGTRSAEARAHSQPELVALSQRALCDMGSDGSMASSEWTVASSRWLSAALSADAAGQAADVATPTVLGVDADPFFSATFPSWASAMKSGSAVGSVTAAIVVVVSPPRDAVLVTIG